MFPDTLLVYLQRCVCCAVVFASLVWLLHKHLLHRVCMFFSSEQMSSVQVACVLPLLI